MNILQDQLREHLNDAKWALMYARDAKRRKRREKHEREALEAMFKFISLGYQIFEQTQEDIEEANKAAKPMRMAVASSPEEMLAMMRQHRPEEPKPKPASSSDKLKATPYLDNQYL